MEAEPAQFESPIDKEARNGMPRGDAAFADNERAREIYRQLKSSCEELKRLQTSLEAAYPDLLLARRAIDAALATEPSPTISPDGLAAVLSVLPDAKNRILSAAAMEVLQESLCRSPPASEPHKAAAKKVFGAEWWRYFFIGFSGPGALTRSLVELKPLKPGESLDLALSATIGRLEKWSRWVQNERKSANSNK